jgi:hypothetical protein
LEISQIKIIQDLDNLMELHNKTTIHLELTQAINNGKILNKTKKMLSLGYANFDLNIQNIKIG